MQTRLELDADGVYAVAAINEADGCIVIANTTEKGIPFEIMMNAKIKGCYITADGENEKKIDIPDTIPGESILVIHTERK